VSRVRSALANPWGRPRFLWAVGIGYVVWTMIPIVYAVLFSFNSTRSIASFTGFSLRWWLSDPDDSLLQDPAIQQAIVQTLKLASLTTLLAEVAVTDVAPSNTPVPGAQTISRDENRGGHDAVPALQRLLRRRLGRTLPRVGVTAPLPLCKTPSRIPQPV